MTGVTFLSGLTITECPLANQPRTNRVDGEGPRPCWVMFVAEAPGRTENVKRRPLVGRSGVRLNVAMESIGLRREDTFVTNVERYRPPKNRKPKKAEIEACRPALWEEVLQVCPRVIVTMGDTAAKQFDKTVQLKKDHGVIRALDDETMLLPTYHPAYTLRNPAFWPIFLEDLQPLKEFMYALGESVTHLATLTKTDYFMGTLSEALEYAKA